MTERNGEGRYEATDATERRGGGGTFRGEAATQAICAGSPEEVREIWVRRGGSVTLQRAPLSLKNRVGTWDNGGDYLGLIRRVKEKFDPRGGLNPGRFVGGI